jgi:ABC-type nitrate/sulfonate/bicarbonate transport system substrate-binding protein
VAQEKGFFAEQDLEVDIRHAQSGEHLNSCSRTRFRWRPRTAPRCQAQRAGAGLVSLAPIGQKSEQGAVARTRINTVTDWAGKTFGYQGLRADRVPRHRARRRARPAR